MIPDLLWIIGFYAAAAILAHRLLRRRSDGERRHYVLVAGNHQLQIEWYIRSLRQFARRTGTDIGITVVLDQSADETGLIVDRFARGDAGIECIRECENESGERIGISGLAEVKNWRKPDGERDDTVVWVELGRAGDVERLPL